MNTNILRPLGCIYNSNIELSETRHNLVTDVVQKIINQENKILERRKNAISKFGNKVTPDLDLKELEKELNPKNLIPLESVIDRSTGEEEKILKCLMKYLTKELMIEVIIVGLFSTSYIICKQPYTDIYIIPYTKKGKDTIYLKEVLGISQEVLDKILSL
ncbi:MAG: hypothetical protein J6K45_00800 [Clostridia bacterium]|nr:hypothetical protein [Clostridia bacterium]